MPRMPASPCRTPRCPRFADQSGYCEACRAARHQDYNERRKQGRAPDDAFYHTRAWRSLRAAHIRREPLCRSCFKVRVIRIGTTVDHIIPIREGGAPLDDENLQTLCDYCNASKTALDLARLKS